MGTPLYISNDLPLELEQIIGQCVAILGIRGSGKSNTAGVLFEELLKHNYPLSIVDIDGEYFGLKEKFEILVAGSGDGVEIEVDVDSAEEIARVSMEKNVPVVLDLSGFLSGERTEFLKEYLTALWNLAGKLRRPYIIGIEEAHEFIPQGVRTELKELIARVALRGRKRGLGAIIVSQRSAKVEKDVLSQAGMLFLHRVVHEADMRVYGELLPWKKTEVKEMVNALETGDCIYVNGESILPIRVRERETFHAGFTPSLEVVVTPQLKQVSQSIIEAIERAREGKGKTSRVPVPQEELERLQAVLREKESQIAELDEIARALGYIKVQVPERAAAELPVFFPAIQRLSAGSGETAHVAACPSMAVSACEEPVALAEDERTAEEEDEDPLDLLPRAVRRHVDRLVSRVAKQGLLDRRIVSFLASRSPNSYSVGQIAAWTGCARGVIEENSPRDLVGAGLIVRERRSDGVRYRCSLAAFVQREFSVYQPDLTARELHAVTRSLREQFSAIK